MIDVGLQGFVNSGEGPSLVPWDIGHPTHVAILGGDTAFWALVPQRRLSEVLFDGALLREYGVKRELFAKEMSRLRFGLTPSCVYFNPTERCNLNCIYCYLPSSQRRDGMHMSVADTLAAMETLHAYFSGHMPPGRLPQVVFHGAEPLLNRDAVMAAIGRYSDKIRFGIQTNATLLDGSAVDFLVRHRVAIGLSLDGSDSEVSDATRKTWSGEGTHHSVVKALQRLHGYPDYSVICTITKHNVRHLNAMVEYLHAAQVPTCMLNALRCTMPGSVALRPDDHEVASHLLSALDRSHELYRSTGRKLVVANFANALLTILAPTARRQMCDISPCGAGRSFFALAANGDLYPCSEFIGMPGFCGGNLARNGITEVLGSENFRSISTRKVEEIDHCKACAIRHFCGAPCPAEAHARKGNPCERGSYCRLYEEQTRYAFRVIADKRADEYLWNDWTVGTSVSFGHS
ncbi:MAG: peptide-modifying radical SAM enzyme CbpB [Myxococcales bacterium]